MLNFIHKLEIGDYLVDHSGVYHKIKGIRDKYLMLDSWNGTQHCVILTKAALLRKVVIEDDDSIRVDTYNLKNVGLENISDYKKADFFEKMIGERVSVNNHLDDYFIKYSKSTMKEDRPKDWSTCLVTGKYIKGNRNAGFYNKDIYILCKVKTKSVGKSMLNKFDYVIRKNSNDDQLFLNERGSYNYKEEMEKDLDRHYEDEKLPEYFYLDFELEQKYI